MSNLASLADTAATSPGLINADGADFAPPSAAFHNPSTLPLSSVSPFERAASDDITAGFSVVAIRPGTKAPGTFYQGRWGGSAGWQHYATKPASEKVIANWRRAPDAGIGVVLGSPAGEGHFVVAVDIDLEDDDKIMVIRDALPSTPVVKTGAKGLTLVYRAPLGIVSKAYNIGTGRAVDFLAHGRQTVMPPSVHPSGVVYRYIGDGGLVPVDTLPIFGLAEKERLEEALRGLGWEDATTPTADHVEAAQVPSQAIGERDAASDHFRWINEAALSRLDVWVPFLDLPNLAATAGGYVATAFWRPSSTGKALADRGANLSFHRDGIIDHGDPGTGGKAGKGYTAIDAVVAATGKNAVEASEWLSDRLGLKAVGDDIFDHDAIIASGMVRAAKVEAIKEDETVAAITENLASAITWDDRAANRARTLRWLVKDLLPAYGVSILGGQSGAGKSFVALELAACVAAGKPFFGHRLKAPGGVLFALGEGGGAMPDRMEALKRARFSDVAPINPTTGKPLNLDALPVAWVPVSNLAQPAPWRAFADHVREVAADMKTRHEVPLRLVIVDTIVCWSAKLGRPGFSFGKGV